MSAVQNGAIINDIASMPLKTLQEVSSDLKLSAKGTTVELIEMIWGKIQHDNDLRNQVFEKCKSRILCGKTSVVWYELTSKATLKGSKEIIKQKCSFNPFMETRYPDIVTTTPILIGAVSGDSEAEYFLRFVNKSKDTKLYSGTTTETYTKNKITTVYINETTECLEIRADHKIAPKIANVIGLLINKQMFIQPKNFAKTFGYKVEDIADKLNGNLLNNSAKPELPIDEFTKSHAESIVKILKAIDSFFEDEDSETLKKILIEGRDSLGDEMLNMPFAALILAGLGKVGLGVSTKISDLRGTPLFDMLQPFLLSKGGYIKFPVAEDGRTNEYTILVGLNTNSICFRTPATENAIKFVREHVII